MTPELRIFIVSGWKTYLLLSMITCGLYSDYARIFPVVFPDFFPISLYASCTVRSPFPAHPNPDGYLITWLPTRANLVLSSPSGGPLGIVGSAASSRCRERSTRASSPYIKLLLVQQVRDCGVPNQCPALPLNSTLPIGEFSDYL